MYRYEPPSLFSGKRGAALIAVILLHIVIVYGFYTGLAGQLVQKIIPPVEIAQIEKPKDIDKPPPPPPKLEEIKPYVPPPPVAVAAQHTVSAPKYDAKHPFKIGEDYYPDASKRAGEEGSCILLMK